MAFFRSASVKHYKLILPRENASQIMEVLGQTDLIYIAPSGFPNMNQGYINQAKSITDCLIKLEEIEQVLVNKGIAQKRNNFTNKEFEELFEEWRTRHRENNVTLGQFLSDVDRKIGEMWNFFKEASLRTQEINRKIEFARENIAVIRAGCKCFGEEAFLAKNQRGSQLTDFKFQEMNSGPRMNFKAGVISLRHDESFKKIIFRISRGNCIVLSFPFSKIFQDSSTKEEANKLVFFLVYEGPKDGFFDQKLTKVLTSYSSCDYLLPESIQELEDQVKSLEQSKVENENIAELNEKALNDYLTNIKSSLSSKNFTKIESHKFYLIKEREIYNKLIEMQLFTNFIQADVFILRSQIGKLQKAFQEMEQHSHCPSGQLIESKEGQPPSYFVCNQFTNSAQEIVETYGVPRYKEANPAYFTIITFPFMFGVMFGDIAHGSLLMLFGTWLIFKKSTDNGSLIEILASHKYLIFLMGFFATYCGIIYNDFLSISLNIFGSCYNLEGSVAGNIVPRMSIECVYPVGIDPIWSISTNYLNYVNSLKMKIAVIIGVVHMTLGVFIKASNTIRFRKLLDFFFEFIPQLIFMVCLFGYMDFLIVFKWLQPWQQLGALAAPSIITTMINFGLKLGKTDDCCGGQPMWGGDYLTTSQNQVQLFLLIISVMCVPMMLLLKPLLLIIGRRMIKSLNESDAECKDTNNQELIEEKDKERGQNDQNEDALEKQQENSTPANQIFIHQFIETIEYVLGCISNTASYLRLWALSLAHEQLSEVLLDQTVMRGIPLGFTGMTGIPLVHALAKQMFGGFFVFAAGTFGILLCIDTMECFLHALRLHWVEFQNKFYSGDGYKFEAFSFKERFRKEIKDV